MIPRGWVAVQWEGIFTYEYIVSIFENVYSKNRRRLCVKASAEKVNSSLFKSWSLGVGWGNNSGMNI